MHVTEQSQELIRSTSYTQTEIISNIIKLYCSAGIECDVTYSKGVFYKKLSQPKYKFDLEPQTQGVIKADCRNLPIKSDSIVSLMFDPPFVGGSVGKGKRGIIKTRFGYYKNIPTLWKMYTEALQEFYRVLVSKGVLIVKCQDTIESGKQHFSEFKIIKEALALGFYPKDKFILLAKNRLISPNQRNQQHCRKFHCYFLVFLKQQSKVRY